MNASLPPELVDIILNQDSRALEIALKALVSNHPEFRSEAEALEFIREVLLGMEIPDDQTMLMVLDGPQRTA